MQDHQEVHFHVNINGDRKVSTISTNQGSESKDPDQEELEIPYIHVNADGSRKVSISLRNQVADYPFSNFATPGHSRSILGKSQVPHGVPQQQFDTPENISLMSKASKRKVHFELQH